MRQHLVPSRGITLHYVAHGRAFQKLYKKAVRPPRAFRLHLTIPFNVGTHYYGQGDKSAAEDGEPVLALTRNDVFYRG